MAHHISELLHSIKCSEKAIIINSKSPTENGATSLKRFEFHDREFRALEKFKKMLVLNKRFSGTFGLKITGLESRDPLQEKLNRYIKAKIVAGPKEVIDYEIKFLLDRKNYSLAAKMHTSGKTVKLEAVLEFDGVNLVAVHTTSFAGKPL